MLESTVYNDLCYSLKKLKQDNEYRFDWYIVDTQSAETVLETGSLTIYVLVNWFYKNTYEIYATFRVFIYVYDKSGKMIDYVEATDNGNISWWAAALFSAERYIVFEYLKEKNIEEISDIRGERISWKDTRTKTAESTK